MSEDKEYIPAEKSTISELAIPICAAAGDVKGIFNIESSRVSAFSGHQIKWLEALAATLSGYLDTPTRAGVPQLASAGQVGSHSGPILRITWNPTGTLIATSSVDRSVKIWDVASRRELMHLEGHWQGVNQAIIGTEGSA